MSDSLLAELRDMTARRDRLAEKVGPLARALAEATEEIARLRSIINGCGWYWPEGNSTEEYCECSWQDVLLSGDADGSVWRVERGGIVETMWCAMLPSAADSDSDDYFEVCEPTEDAAKAKVADELARRAALAETGAQP